MDEAFKFKTLDELYKRLKPALYSKVDELKRKGLNYIKAEDIWNYLLESEWEKCENLSISQMTSDILYAQDYLLSSYVMNILKETQRETNTNEKDLL